MERPGGALEWGSTHTSTFELKKTGLLVLTRKHVPHPSQPRASVPTPRPSIAIGGQVIQPSPSHRFLGVIIDDQLRWREQAVHALVKGMTYVLACRQLTIASKGIRAPFICRLYISVVIPKLLYAADIWATSSLSQDLHDIKKALRQLRGVARLLARVQREAAHQVTGGMASTATDVLDFHANFLPFSQLLHRVCARAALRLASLAKGHPLYPLVRRAATFRRHHCAPLHTLLHTFAITPGEMEAITPVRRAPTWIPSHTTIIPKSKDAAKESHDEDSSLIRVYLDGSSHGGNVGAGAILIHGTTSHHLLFHLGPATHHTVYEAELVGLILGAHLL
ncbi:hypothetical protein CONPUDRAFT_64937, partial [Coniophora puteana RWD-64-598 SS2]